MAVSELEEQEWFAREILVHEDRLRRQLRCYLDRRADVDDALQEAYSRMLALSREERERMKSPVAFLFTIARNVSMDLHRRPSTLSIDAIGELDSRQLPDERPEPGEVLNATQERDRLRAAIASLPDRCREVIVMRKVQGKSQREIAMLLGITESTVEKHVANGVRLCAKFMREEPSAEAPSRAPLHLVGRVKSSVPR
jgi:RNA polymerase sigma factor (sigma-70 family)